MHLDLSVPIWKDFNYVYICCKLQICLKNIINSYLFVAENEKLPKSLRNHNQELGTSFVEVNEGEEIVVTVDIEPGSAPVKIKELGETKLKQCAGLTGETPTARTGNFSKCVGRQETVDRPKGNSRATSSDANIADEQLLTICKQLSNVKPPGIVVYHD